MYDFIKFIKRLKIDSFYAIHHSEWADIPEEHYEFAVVNGKVIKETIYRSEFNSKINNDTYDPSATIDIQAILKINSKLIGYHHSYEESEYNYRKANNLL